VVGWVVAGCATALLIVLCKVVDRMWDDWDEEMSE
jgi:hypothetical protein